VEDEMAARPHQRQHHVGVGADSVVSVVSVDERPVVRGELLDLRPHIGAVRVSGDDLEERVRLPPLLIQVGVHMVDVDSDNAERVTEGQPFPEGAALVGADLEDTRRRGLLVEGAELGELRLDLEDFDHLMWFGSAVTALSPLGRTSPL
jgi:hypothetical protein